MLKVTNPATGQLIKELNEDTAASVSEKYQKARAAQKTWWQTPLSKRMDVIKTFRSLLEKNKEELSKTLTLEVGKPIKQSRNEIQGTLGRIDFFLQSAETVFKNESVHSEKGLEEVISFEPLGVIANISAWNYPYFVGSNVFIPALLAGNAILYKPSEFSSLTGQHIADLLWQAGVPKDVFALVIGTGAVGSEILKLPINGVFFTGSYATGKKINEAVAGKLIKVQLELGGKDPTYVCEDADIKNAAEGLADGAFYNNGQSCCSVERIYVNAKVYDSFVEHFVKTVNDFKIGDPLSEETYIGPLTRSAQVGFVDGQVQDALKKGAKLLAGGKKLDGKGNYYSPTVFSNVNHTMELMREESFGPIIGIQKVANDEEAVQLMNDTAYGLTSGVYTPNKTRAEKLLGQIQSGSVYWNCCDRVSPRLPWSGRGHSGIGLTLSTHGIMTFTQPKAWHLRG